MFWNSTFGYLGMVSHPWGLGYIPVFIFICWCAASVYDACTCASWILMGSTSDRHTTHSNWRSFMCSVISHNCVVNMMNAESHIGKCFQRVTCWDVGISLFLSCTPGCVGLVYWCVLRATRIDWNFLFYHVHSPMFIGLQVYRLFMIRRTFLLLCCISFLSGGYNGSGNCWYWCSLVPWTWQQYFCLDMVQPLISV